ncbi:DUF4350 domain-containing protein [Methylocaldum sp. BRCS4]|uniref:DUF4350 domain-containing protein n=1 Tax=Methylocaldum sp. GT1TLB TaxID=3438965 RepID=UPI0012EC528F|nr:DUF4350 domain-containing protein [Methylocaldum sp. BRCS4]
MRGSKKTYCATQVRACDAQRTPLYASASRRGLGPLATVFSLPLSRTVIWSSTGVLVLVALSAAWFFSNFDYVPVTTWEKPGKEARRDPYLAFDRLMGRLGRPAVRVSNALVLDELTPGGVLLLDRGRRIYVNARRADALFDWVSRGGYLIVAAEYRQVDDPILKRLGIGWYEPPKIEPKKTAATEEDGAEDEQDGAQMCEPSDARSDDEPDTVEVHLPARDQPLRLQRTFGSNGLGLVPTDPAPVWKAGVVDTRSTVLHYDYGQGRITVLDGFTFLSNRRIGEHDHAELIWGLMRHYQPQGEVRLATRLEVPTLWEWLAESAWMALISGALLIAAWLWRIVPRFGGMLRSPNPARRSLIEHLSAVGRAVWRHGEDGRAHWENVMRQELRRYVLQRHPRIAQVSESEQARILSGMSGIPENRVTAVLAAPDKLSPRHFVDCVRTVQELEQRL